MYSEDEIWGEIKAIQSLPRTAGDEGAQRVRERVDEQLARWVERADVAARDPLGNTPLLWVLFVAFNARAELVMRLLERGADPCACNADGWSPLHVAAARPSSDGALEVLIAAGADPAARQQDGQTPLHLAATMDELESVQRLLAAGADPDARDRAGRIPLDLADDPSVCEALEAALRRREGPETREPCCLH
jgi:hypothetical protein